VPELGHDWGKKFLAVLLTPVPSALWQDKYRFFGESPIQGFLSTGAAAAFFTEFYESFGPAGVVCGMALVGWVSRKIYNIYKANPSDPFGQISLALLWAFLFHAYGRNSVTLIFYGLIYTFTPVWIGRWMLSQRYRGNHLTLSKLGPPNG
jgi:hypothetical protein